MKNYTLHFIVLASAFSFSCMAQGNQYVQVSPKIVNAQFNNNMASNNDLAVVSYHVEERINMNLGGSITTYDVPSLSMVNTNNLGPNNTRIITPRYGKTKVKESVIAAVNTEQPKASSDTLETSVASIQDVGVVLVKTDLVAPEETKEFVTIDIIPVYERVLDKGYQSVDMLKKVGDSRYFQGDLVTAAKWYTKLFDITTDLEAVYYYRYARSLTSINQNEKADEMMKLFESKNSSK